MISVIIPTYNSPAALDLCVASAVKGQKNKNEIIVVVDGTYHINASILEKHSKNIKVLRLEDNVGLCRATNLGVYNAKYDQILIVNDDNVFPKNWDAKLSEKFQPGWVWAPNQVEPYLSMFKQFLITDLGRSVETFDLEKFWRYADSMSMDKVEFSGSTLPIYMSKLDYLKIGGWDENYQMGVVADWDFFLKCKLNGYRMVRTYNCNFYHFVSLSTNGTEEKKKQRQLAEEQGHEYARYKWGTYIKHNPSNNDKYL